MDYQLLNKTVASLLFGHRIEDNRMRIDNITSAIPDYSANMTLAWKVVEKFHDTGLYIFSLNTIGMKMKLEHLKRTFNIMMVFIIQTMKNRATMYQQSFV